MKNILIDKNADGAINWNTSSFGTAADTSPMELAALGEHLRRCDSERGALFPLKCVAEALGRVAAPRFVTTIVTIAMLITLVSWIL